MEKRDVYEPLVVFRGPLMVGAICWWVLHPYLLSLSWQTIVTAVSFAVGMAVGLYDASQWIQRETKSFLRKTIQGISLDDIFKHMHHAESSAIGTVVGSAVGPFAMYGLPLNEEQRIRLFQSGMELSDDIEARRILIEPGGWKDLLPESTREWIFSNEEKHARLSSLPPVLPDCDADSHNSLTLSDASDIYESEKDKIKERKLDDNDQGRPRSPLPRSEIEGAGAGAGAGPNKNMFVSLPKAASRVAPPLPTEVFGSIIKEMVTETLQRHLAKFNDNNSLEIASAVASLALLGQFCWSRRSRETIWGLLSGSTTAALSAAWIASVSLLLVKRSNKLESLVPTPLSRSTSTSTSSAPVSVYLRSVLRVITDRGKSQWQGVIAVFVLLYWWRRRRSAGDSP